MAENVSSEQWVLLRTHSALIWLLHELWDTWQRWWRWNILQELCSFRGWRRPIVYGVGVGWSLDPGSHCDGTDQHAGSCTDREVYTTARDKGQFFSPPLGSDRPETAGGSIRRLYLLLHNNRQIIPGCRTRPHRKRPRCCIRVADMATRRVVINDGGSGRFGLCFGTDIPRPTGSALMAGWNRVSSRFGTHQAVSLRWFHTFLGDGLPWATRIDTGNSVRWHQTFSAATLPMAFRCGGNCVKWDIDHGNQRDTSSFQCPPRKEIRRRRLWLQPTLKVSAIPSKPVRLSLVWGSAMSNVLAGVCSLLLPAPKLDSL